MRYYLFKNFNKNIELNKSRDIYYLCLPYLIIHFKFLKIKSRLTQSSEILICYCPFDVKIKILISPETWLPSHQFYFYQST